MARMVSLFCAVVSVALVGIFATNLFMDWPVQHGEGGLPLVVYMFLALSVVLTALSVSLLRKK